LGAARPRAGGRAQWEQARLRFAVDGARASSCPPRFRLGPAEQARSRIAPFPGLNCGQGASGACCPCLAGRAPRECRAPPCMVPGAAVATVTRARVTAAELPTFRASAALGHGRLRTTGRRCSQRRCLLFKLAPLAVVLVWQWMHSNLVEPETPAPRCCDCGAGFTAEECHQGLPLASLGRVCFVILRTF
jgi:hypothetical protein